MIRENLGNFALRIWLALAGAAVVVMVGMPAITGLAAGKADVVLAGMLAGGCFLLSGRLLDRLASSRVEYWGKEAAVWDQAGMEEEARRAFDRAMAVLDGWMLSPGARKRLGLWLGRRLASFVMARQNPTFEDMLRVRAYLRTFPGDLDTIQSWLHWQAESVDRHHFDEELLEVIARSHPDNFQVQKALARVFIKGGRTDFIAMATYKKLLQKDDLRNVVLESQLALMLDESRRPDQAGRNEDEASGSLPASSIPDGENKKIRHTGTLNSSAPGVGQNMSKMARHVAIGWTVAAALAAAVLLVLIIFWHANDSSLPEKVTRAPKGEIAQTERFTIQVAAYLKEKDAVGYVRSLQLKGYDAFHTRASKNRKQWYQVKIGRFATRAEAQDFGSRLKKEGIIDDFYVANYKH